MRPRASPASRAREVSVAEEGPAGLGRAGGRIGPVHELGHLERQRALSLASVRTCRHRGLERLDLLARAEAEDPEVGAGDAVIGVDEPLVEGERRRQRRVEPERRAGALPELLAVRPRDQRRREGMRLDALHAADEVDARGEVPPLVAPAELEGHAVTPVQLEEVERLHHLVAELGVADAARVEARCHGFLREHPVHAEVLADVAEPVDRAQLAGPFEVVHDRRRVVALERQVALDLGADPRDPSLDDLAFVKLSLRGSAARVADEAGRTADEADGPMARQLEATHRHEQHEVAEMEARRGRIEAAVVRQRSARHRRAQRVQVRVVGDHPPPLQIVEDRGACVRRGHRSSIRTRIRQA